MRQRKKKQKKRKLNKKKEYNDYIPCVSAKRTQLAQEAKDAGFESLLEYLMFLEVYETCLTSSSSGRCSLVNMFEYRKKQQNNT